MKLWNKPIHNICVTLKGVLLNFKGAEGNVGEQQGLPGGFSFPEANSPLITLLSVLKVHAVSISHQQGSLSVYTLLTFFILSEPSVHRKSIITQAECVISSGFRTNMIG